MEMVYMLIVQFWEHNRHSGIEQTFFFSDHTLCQCWAHGAGSCSGKFQVSKAAQALIPQCADSPRYSSVDAAPSNFTATGRTSCARSRSLVSCCSEPAEESVHTSSPALTQHSTPVHVDSRELHSRVKQRGSGDGADEQNQCSVEVVHRLASPCILHYTPKLQSHQSGTCYSAAGSWNKTTQTEAEKKREFPFSGYAHHRWFILFMIVLHICIAKTNVAKLFSLEGYNPQMSAC